jgi:hypothetical protein
MGKHEAGYARADKDLYPTRERWVTETLLAHVGLAGLIVWEPATGMGDMAEVLKTAGAARVYCSDIVDRGYPLDAIHDFTLPSSPAPELRFDVIVTNPSYGDLRRTTAEAFIETGLSHIGRGGTLALLLPCDFDTAGRRRRLCAECPHYRGKIVLTRRIVFVLRSDGEREAPKENHAWFIWQRTALRISAAPLTLYGPAAEPKQQGRPRLRAAHPVAAAGNGAGRQAPARMDAEASRESRPLAGPERPPPRIPPSSLQPQLPFE